MTISNYTYARQEIGNAAETCAMFAFKTLVELGVVSKEDAFLFDKLTDKAAAFMSQKPKVRWEL